MRYIIVTIAALGLVSGVAYYRYWTPSAPPAWVLLVLCLLLVTGFLHYLPKAKELATPHVTSVLFYAAIFGFGIGGYPDTGVRLFIFNYGSTLLLAGVIGTVFAIMALVYAIVTDVRTWRRSSKAIRH